MNDKIYVVGHKNPDTDSICSALAYANLKRLLGENAVACRLGPLNEESKFVLNRFGLENPLLMTDARSQLKDIDIDKPRIVKANCTLKEAWDYMFLQKNKSIFVSDDEDKLIGIVSTSNLVVPRMMLDQDLDKLMCKVPLEAMAKTLDGKVILDSKRKNNGKVYVVTLNEDEVGYTFEDSICILSNHVENQKKLIDLNVAVMIISCGQKLDDHIIELAKAKDIAIIKTNLDTMKVANNIMESIAVEELMTKNPIVFSQDEYVNEVSKKIMKTRFRSYPVVDERNHIVGAVSRYHLLNHSRKQLILVDHSSKVQAINFIDDADILEIIDHHHIGDVQTSVPIYYRNQRCGCTCTIVAELYRENNVVPTPEMAGIMASAIISDTLKFKSKTTTQLDIDTCYRLAEIANIDIDTYALDMLSASIALKDATMSQILNRDMKVYQIEGFKIAVAQTNYRNLEDIQGILPTFRENMRNERKAKDFDLMIMMFTHVAAEGTMFVFSGKLSYIMKDLIKTQFDDKTGYDPEIISRKQQLIPKLSILLKNI